VRPLLLIAFALLAGVAYADRFDDFVQAKMQDEKIAGLQFAVTYKGKTVMSRCYGLADVDKKTAVTKDTPFEIASVSKPIIATAVMMLWEDGKFKLDDPIGKYVKEMPLAWVDVPIRNLLSHTSGIPEFRDSDYFFQHRLEDTPFTEITKHMDTALVFDPGHQFSYSNTNYVMLGKLIEGVTGKPFTDFLKKRIFDPLGMTHTGFIGTEDHAIGYAALRSGFAANRGCSLAWAGPGSSIVSTAEDMATFDAALDGHKLIKNSTMLEMLQATSTHVGLIDYGLGWQIENLQGSAVAMHAGKMNGFASMYIRLINERISIVVLSNSSDIDGNAVTRGLLSLYLPEFSSQSTTPIVDDDPDMTTFHTKIMRDIAAGHPNMSLFSEDYKKHITEEQLTAMGGELNRGGPIRTLQIIKRTTKGAFEVYEYLMTQGQTRILVTFIMDSAGKVGGMTVAAP